MTDDNGDARLVQAASLLAACAWRFRDDTDTDEIAGKLTEARHHYDEVARAAPPGSTETAATVAIGRATAAWFALRLCIDVEHDLNSGWDYDWDGPPLDGLEEDDEDGVSRAPAQEAVRAARAALEADPDDALVPFQLGGALAWLGDRDGAVAAYEEALRRDPWDDRAMERLAQLDAEPAAPPPPPPAPVGRRYGFTVLRDEARITNSEWSEGYRAFPSIAAARAAADGMVAFATDPADLTREDLGGCLRLALRIHRPGRTGAEYDLMDRVPRTPDAGPFRIDWSGIPVAEVLDPPLPPGRLVQVDGHMCGYG